MGNRDRDFTKGASAIGRAATGCLSLPCETPGCFRWSGSCTRPAERQQPNRRANLSGSSAIRSREACTSSRNGSQRIRFSQSKSRRRSRSPPSRQRETQLPSSFAPITLRSLAEPDQGVASNDLPRNGRRSAGRKFGRSTADFSHPLIRQRWQRVIWKRVPEGIDQLKPIRNGKLCRIREQCVDGAHIAYRHRFWGIYKRALFASTRHLRHAFVFY